MSVKRLLGITDVEWQVLCSYPYQVTYNSGTYACNTTGYVNNAGVSIAFSYPTQPYVITLRYRVKNSCGWSGWSAGNSKQIKSCSGFNFTTSPNPATNSIDVALDEQSSKGPNSMAIREIQITDKSGNMVKQFKYSATTKRASLNISELNPDVYYIRVFNGKEWKSQSLIKR